MEDHRLKSYCLVVETKSFSRAAQAKHMTQSAMSRLVKGLEDETGVTLLLRRGKAAVPTPEGMLFYEHAKRILDGYAKMEQDVAAAGRAARGALRLGVSRTPAVHLLPQVLYDFSKAHPGIRIELSVCATENVVRDLRDGRIDLGLVEDGVGDRTVQTEAVAGDEIVLVAPEDHPLAKKRKVTVQDLAGESFLLPERGTGTRELVEGYLRDLGFDARKVRVRMSLGSPELIVQMAESGLGIAFVSKWAAFAAVKEGTLKVLKLQGRSMKRQFLLVCLGQEPSAPAARTFREFLRGYKFFVPF
jgi:DNA-binding transcriptional LysR family regulator